MSFEDLFQSELFFFLFFAGIGIVFIAIIVSVFVKHSKEEQYNDSQPLRTVQVMVVAKEAIMEKNPQLGSLVTFEFVSGERKQLKLDAQAAAQIVVGDEGKLSYRGNRYVIFVRNKRETNNT